MGTWGTALYANDTTCDIRGEYIDKLKRGKTNKTATQELIKLKTDTFDNPEDEPLFWFALADTQWDFGRLLPEVKEKALYFLSMDHESERWKESGIYESEAWQKTLKALTEKLEKPQPPEKKISKYRLYKCEWILGDVFAYRLSGAYSIKKGFAGKYMAFRKVSEAIWWPGHIVPEIQIYKWTGDTIPQLCEISDKKLLPVFFSPEVYEKDPDRKPEYKVMLISKSKREIPKDNLTYLGNLSGNDLTPLQTDRNRTGYFAIGWESSKSNMKLEHYFIDTYLMWKKCL